MMNRRLFFSIMLSCSFLLLNAQKGQFGYISFNSTLKLMPEYLDAESNLQKIQADYHEEIERSKREFERQYIEFMLEQDHLSPSIVAKRQKELQLLMDNNAQFRDRVQSELEAKRAELLVPLKKKLLEAVSTVCIKQGLDYVIDIGAGTYLFINEERGIDISLQVYKALGIEREPEPIVESGLPVINNEKQSIDK